MSMSKATRYRKAPFGQPGKRGAILSPHRFCVPCLARLGVARRRAEKLFGIHQGTLKRYGFSAMDRTEVVRKAQKARRYTASSRGLSNAIVAKIQREAFESETAAAKRQEAIWGQHKEVLRWRANCVAASQYAKHGRKESKRLIRAVRCRIWKLARTWKSSRSTTSLLGCDPEQFKDWLESKFLPGMSWSNYGQWEIDHVRPCASFDLTDNEQAAQCFHYTNTQPMWRTDNRTKHSWWAGVHHSIKAKQVLSAA